MVRRGAERSGKSAALLVAVGCVLAVALCGCGRSSGTAVAAPARSPHGSAYTLMQMNLCLSGLAGCYAKRVHYPAVVEEAISRIRSARPDAVTFSEACSGDVAQIARRTGYNLSFAKVIYYGKPLPCIRPGGRGLYGDAVLTKAAIVSTASQPFRAQAGPERRVWLCATTRIGDVCTAQLASHAAIEAAANAPQCAELRAILAGRAVARPLIFGGDLNRRQSCAPPGFWTRDDGSAHQDPGSQQVYGTDAFRSPSARVVPAIHTDHDVLLVRSYFSPRR